jgi:hypothetical protein
MRGEVSFLVSLEVLVQNIAQKSSFNNPSFRIRHCDNGQGCSVDRWSLLFAGWSTAGRKELDFDETRYLARGNKCIYSHGLNV